MSAPPDGERITAGARVRIKGLTSAASLDLNGRAGVCTGWVPASERYEVTLFAAPGLNIPSRALAVKRINLAVLHPEAGLAIRPLATPLALPDAT
jgi:hypothetical protein